MVCGGRPRFFLVANDEGRRRERGASSRPIRTTVRASRPGQAGRQATAPAGDGSPIAGSLEKYRWLGFLAFLSRVRPPRQLLRAREGQAGALRLLSTRAAAVDLSLALGAAPAHAEMLGQATGTRRPRE